ncbi:MAG: hypothetical protein H6832_09300 [Planctomycetes bacterium]|nr:hypothetical protein [Planctomycetota bacterium]
MKCYAVIVPLAVCFGVGGALRSQGEVGLAGTGSPTGSTVFTLANVQAAVSSSISSIEELSMVPDPLAAGRFYGSLTVVGLPSSAGGAGSTDILSFVYVRSGTTETVTYDSNAAVMNTSGAEFGFQWGPDGLYAICDSGAQKIQATRATTSAALGSRTAISGMPTSPSPARMFPCFINGVRSIVHDSGAIPSTIVSRTHDLAGASVGSTTTTVVSGGNPFGAYAVAGSDGDAEALLSINYVSASSADIDWNGDLQSSTAPILWPPFSSYGGYAWSVCLGGGRVFFVNQAKVVEQVDVIGLLGDELPAAGGQVDLTAFSPILPAAATADVTLFYAATSYLSPPVTVTGTQNMLGIFDSAGLIYLGSGTHAQASGRAALSFTSPAFSAGTVIPIQGLTQLGAGGNPFWTSTAAIRYN